MLGLPERAWLTIQEVAALWNVTEDDIKHFLMAGKLSASIVMPLMILLKCKVECDGHDMWHEGLGEMAISGLFNIDAHSPLKWKKNVGGEISADLCAKYVYLSNKECIGFKQCESNEECQYSYRLMKSYNIEINDIVITPKAINHFIDEFCSLQTSRFNLKSTSSSSTATVEISSIQSKLEKDAELCTRLKREGVPDCEIAKELRRTFPNIYPSRIGRLITETPGVHLSTDAFRQRGNRLLRHNLKH